MSFTVPPRLHFKGRFETDVCTANNDDIVRPIDAVNVRIRFGVDGIPDTDEAFIEWMRSVDPQASRTVARSGWNYYGGNGCRFIDCTVVSVDRGSGLITSAAIDSTVGAAVLLGENPPRKSGIMVDLNPEGTWGTQIYADAIQLVADNVRLQGPPTTAHSRWLHFSRNTEIGGFTGAAATWQSCIPKERLAVSPGATGALAELHLSAMAHKGVVIRYCTYLLAPQISGHELVDRYLRNESPRNPAAGLVIGTIGVWEDGDYASMLNGRLLLPGGDITWNHGQVRFGPAVVAVNAPLKTAIVDLITCVPEIDAVGAKIPAGESELIVVPDQGGPVEKIGTIAYDQLSYEQGGGMVALRLTDEQISSLQEGKLAILFGGNATIVERDLVVDTDNRNVYLNEGDTSTISVTVRYRGGVPRNPVRLRVQQWFNPEKSISGPISAGQRAIEHIDEIVTNADGVAKITIQALKPMLGVLQFLIDGEEDSPSPAAGCIVNFRVFPEDNYDHISDEDLDFATVYREVLRYYHLIYPAMTRVFSLADEGEVIANAAEIKRLINPEIHDTWAYMPRTREMSSGKRRLLHRWLNKVAN